MNASGCFSTPTSHLIKKLIKVMIHTKAAKKTDTLEEIDVSSAHQGALLYKERTES